VINREIISSTVYKILKHFGVFLKDEIYQITVSLITNQLSGLKLSSHQISTTKRPIKKLTLRSTEKSLRSTEIWFLNSVALCVFSVELCATKSYLIDVTVFY